MNPTDPPLDSLQGWLQEILVSPGGPDAAEIEQIVEASPTLAAADRLAIYRRSYYLRLIKCMEGQFPALCHALGEDLFDQFARQYLQVHPSTSYTLYELGRRFPEYLEETRPDRDAPEESREIWIDFMVDLARYEWDLFSMFDAPGNEDRPFADETTPDNRLKLQPCFKIHRSRFPVAWYYHEVKQENDPPFPEKTESYIAMARRDYLTRSHPLSSVQFRVLEKLTDGFGIATALETVASERGASPEDYYGKWSAPGGTRQHWIKAGFFVDAEIVSAHPSLT